MNNAIDIDQMLQAQLKFADRSTDKVESLKHAPIFVVQVIRKSKYKPKYLDAMRTVDNC